MSDGAPRILLVAFTPFPAGNGLATRLAQRITSLSDAGYAIDVLTPKTPDLPHVSRLAGARILRVPMPKTPSSLADRYGAFERAVLRQHAASDYDVIHTFDPWSGAPLAAARRGARFVAETEGHPPPGEGDAALEAELRRRDREVIREADALLVPTEELARRAKGLGAPPGQVLLLRPSADPSLFTPPPDRRRRPPGRLKLVACRARFAPRDIALLLAAVRALPADVPWSLEVIGEVDASEKALLAERGLHPVTYVEPPLYEELPPYFAAADVGLVLDAGPVRGEATPAPLQVLAEMAASGLPIIAPALPAVRETFDDGTHAILVSPDDARAVATAIELLAREPVRRRQLGASARARVSEVLDEHRATIALLALYNRLVAPSIQVAIDAVIEPSQASATPSGDIDTKPGTPVARPSQKEPLQSARTPLPIKSPLLDEQTDPGSPAEPPRAHSVVTRRAMLGALAPPLPQAPESGTDPDLVVHDADHKPRKSLAEITSASTSGPTGASGPRRG